MKSSVFWDTTQFSPLKINLRRNISPPPSGSKSTTSKILARSRQKVEQGPTPSHRAIVKLCLLPDSCQCHTCRIFDLENEGDGWCVSRKLRSTSEWLHVFISRERKTLHPYVLFWSWYNGVNANLYLRRLVMDSVLDVSVVHSASAFVI
jgi:hypothetical protein